MTPLPQSSHAAQDHARTEKHIVRCVPTGILAVLMPFTLMACAPPASPSAPPASPSAPPASPSAPPILLFNGAGTSANDVAAVEAILHDNGLEYATVNSSKLNRMSAAQLMAYRLMIIPGGNFIAIGEGLTSSTTARIHNAVQGGVNYMGICAGAFLAGDGPYNSLNLTSGVRFDFYADESRGIRKAAVAITGIGTPTLEHYWEDGPQLTGWGAVVGKYPDGTPAIVEGSSGKGWVILAGVHPEAPASWRRGMAFTTPASVDHAYAATLIHAALNGTRLPHY
jgi:glutamine amidotransferase-like uncharacterized protein